MKKLLVALAVALACGAAVAEPIEMRNLVAYDGDTIRTSIRPFPELSALSIRVRGIDTPELRGQCDSEKALARKARDTLNGMLKVHAVQVVPYTWDKYGGRVVADVYLDTGEKIADIMIREGLAYAYDGGRKRSWCN